MAVCTVISEETKQEKLDLNRMSSYALPVAVSDVKVSLSDRKCK
jgi:hypothetical protein